MLSNRYIDDNKAEYYLNKLQEKYKRQLEIKIKNNEYKFEEYPCIVCGDSYFEILSNKDRYGLYMSVVICKSCGLVQTNPRMDENSYSEFYNDEYRPLYNGSLTVDENFINEQVDKGEIIYKVLNKYNILSKKHINRILEVGCSSGGILHIFNKNKFEVLGIDLNHDHVTKGKNIFGIDLRTTTIKNILEEPKFDLILYADVFEHICDPIKELNMIHQLLSDKGFLVLMVPGIKNLKYSYKCDFLKYLQNAHIHHFSLTSLDNLLNMAAFDRIHGDEGIFAVYTKRNQKRDYFINDFRATLDFLKDVEKNRIRYYMFSILKNLIIRVLKALNLYNTIRLILLKIHSNKIK